MTLRKKSNVYVKLKFDCERVKNIVGKKRECWLPAFSPSPTMFSKAFLSRVMYSGGLPQYTGQLLGLSIHNHPQKHSLYFSPRFCKFECNTTSDWLNHMV